MRPFRNGNENSRGRNYPTNEAPLLQNELQNLDMELQILKRQREIIFKQREVENQLLSQRLNTFNQPSSLFGHPEPKQNYNTNYGASYSNSSNSKGYKRTSERSFDHPAPKQARSNDWGDKHVYKQHIKPQPLMNIRTQHYKKVTKPLPNKPKPFEPRGNNPNYRPQKDFHKNLPKATVNKTSEKPVIKNATSEVKKKSKMSDDFLRPGVAPNPSVNGRLELALGELLKCIKTSPLLSDDQKKCLNTAGVRSLKAVLRQRISTVMMNKRVVSKVETVAHYRKKYPKDVDDELIEAIKQANTKREKIYIKNISATETERIHVFFKSRINRLLKNKVQNMIDNIFSMYGDNETEILKCIKDLPKLEDEKETNDENKNATDDVIMLESSGDDVNNYNIQECSVESDKNTTENISADIDVQGNNANNDNAQENVAELVQNTSENNVANVTIDLTNVENNGEEEINEKQNNERSKLKQYYKLMDLLIENRLPKLLLNFKDEFVKILYCDKDFIIGKEMIMKELKETLRKSLLAANNIDKNVTATISTGPMNQESDSIIPDANETQNEHIKDITEKVDFENNENKSEQQVNEQIMVKPTPQIIQKASQLYVMLLGRPSLPPKSEIYDFLNKFNPKSVKKHKTVNNLLVIGFEDKIDYDKILHANGTKVGDATFIIKANEVIASDKEKEKTTYDNSLEKVSQKTAGQEQEKNADQTNIDDVKESDEKKIDETRDNNKEVEVKMEVIEFDDKSTGINNDEINDEKLNETDINNTVTDVTDKNGVENVIVDENKESTADDKVDDTKGGNSMTDDAKDTNYDVTQEADEVGELEAIKESEEDKAKAKTRAAAVATPTRTSSRLANITPSTIKTRRASRLAQ